MNEQMVFKETSTQNLFTAATRPCARLFSERSQEHVENVARFLQLGLEGPSVQVWASVVLMICSVYMHVLKWRM